MRRRFQESYGVTAYDATVLTADRELASWFDASAKKAKTPKLVANWISSELLRLLGEDKISIGDCRITPENLAELTDVISSGAINGKIGKEVFAEMYATGKSAKAIIEEKGLAQVSDTGAISAIVAEAIEKNPKQAAEYRAGNERVLQYMVGQVMKLSKGKANPQLAIAELKKQLM